MSLNPLLETTEDLIGRGQLALAKARPADIAERILLFPALLERLKELEAEQKKRRLTVVKAT